ncbi:HEAT repeat domain-containing protein [Solibacillus silvestris]|uniref:HEAT repeat domain-containing protein n=1 Tax=Solibacillus silvestris TaxID=76853 RepID=UPI003F7F88D8
MSHHKQETAQQLPENFGELKKAVNRTADWEERLNAVQELAKFKTEETIKILQYVAKADLVTKVREAAASQLKEMGQQAEAPETPKGELFKDLRKIFRRIKKSLPQDHTYEDFKVKLEKMRIDIYNTYEGEKGAQFDVWLKDMWETTATRK